MAVEKDGDVTPREVNSLKKLASQNFARFAVQVQHVSAEVQMKIIEQLPEFKKLATEAIDRVSKAHEATLNSIDHTADHADQGVTEWRRALIAMLDDPDLTLDDKLRITREIGETVKVQASMIAEGNKLKAALFLQAVLGVVGVIGIIVVAIAGGKFGIEQDGDSA